MPLEHGKSKKAFEKNLKTEMHEGKPMKQSLAIAYAVKRKAQKHKMAEGGMLTDDGYESKDSGMHQDEFHEAKPMAQAQKHDPGVHIHINAGAQAQDDKMLNQHGDDEIGPEGRHMAEGGRVAPMANEQSAEHEEDMVGRIMKKRQHMYSEGGKVANDTHQFEDDFDDNQFDVLPEEDDLESSYNGKNSGDEDGGLAKDDVVDRIMMKKKKQHNPSPA